MEDEATRRLEGSDELREGAVFRERTRKSKAELEQGQVWCRLAGDLEPLLVGRDAEDHGRMLAEKRLEGGTANEMRRRRVEGESMVDKAKRGVPFGPPGGRPEAPVIECRTLEGKVGWLLDQAALHCGQLTGMDRRITTGERVWQGYVDSLHERVNSVHGRVDELNVDALVVSHNATVMRVEKLEKALVGVDAVEWVLRLGERVKRLEERLGASPNWKPSQLRDRVEKLELWRRRWLQGADQAPRTTRELDLVRNRLDRLEECSVEIEADHGKRLHILEKLVEPLPNDVNHLEERRLEIEKAVDDLMSWKLGHQGAALTMVAKAMKAEDIYAVPAVVAAFDNLSKAMEALRKPEEPGPLEHLRINKEIGEVDELVSPVGVRKGTVELPLEPREEMPEVREGAQAICDLHAAGVLSDEAVLEGMGPLREGAEEPHPEPGNQEGPPVEGDSEPQRSEAEED